MKQMTLSRTVFALGLGAMALLAAGCASTSTADWNNRVGNYTYAQAVTDLGNPSQTNAITDGGLIVQWINHSAGENPFAVRYDNFYSPYAGYTPFQGRTGDHVLVLKFGPDHKLADWARVTR